MLDRITGMQVLVRAAALANLSAAARDLGMSPSMATKHVAALEARLGVQLLHRTTRRVVPTEAGRRFLESAERVLAEVEEAEAAALAERLEATGVLRANAPVSFGLRVLGPVLAAFGARYPGLTVDLGLADRPVDLVEEGWDVAVRVGRVEDARLVARRLAPCGTRVAASPDYLARRGTPRTLADLAGHDCLGYTLSTLVGPERWAFGRDGRVVAPVRGSLRAGNGDVLVATAVAGLGLVYQPTFLVRDEIRSGRLVAVELDQPTVRLAGVHAVYPAGRRPPAKVRAFIDFLAERFAGEPPWERGLDAPPAA